MVVKNGRIVSAGSRANTPVPPGVRLLDAHGAVLTAGFWNNHIHLMTPDVLNAATANAETLKSSLRAAATGRDQPVSEDRKIGRALWHVLALPS